MFVSNELRNERRFEVQANVVEFATLRVLANFAEAEAI